MSFCCLEDNDKHIQQEFLSRIFLSINYRLLNYILNGGGAMAPAPPGLPWPHMLAFGK
jgi:hypothetical protein